MDEYDYRKNIYGNYRDVRDWEFVISYIPRKINGKWKWLTPFKRRWVEDYSYGEFTAYYEYDF